MNNVVPLGPVIRSHFLPKKKVLSHCIIAMKFFFWRKVVQLQRNMYLVSFHSNIMNYEYMNIVSTF